MRADRPRAAVSWSSGKDSAFALWQVARQGELEVVELLTTVTKSFGRVSIHGVREALLERQARELGLPLRKVEIPYPCPNAAYEEAMATAVKAMRGNRVSAVVFGDLFLEDIRAYRESKLAATGLRPVFPLWGRNTTELADEMVRVGMRARLVCVDPRKLSKDFAGREFDAELLKDLPRSVDPCGENGEFHTFVTAGPMFAHPIAVEAGEIVERDGFVFADLKPE
ncbi:MAG: diphthine--ammonia ligase [Thermoplasmata archaeon]